MSTANVRFSQPLTQQERAALEEIRKHFSQAKALLFGQISEAHRQEIFAVHRDNTSLDWCIVNGDKAAEEIFAALAEREKIEKEAKLIHGWERSNRQGYAKGSPINCDLDCLVIEATSEEAAKALFKLNGGWDRSGECPPYVVRHEWRGNRLYSYSRWVGYD